MIFQFYDSDITDTILAACKKKSVSSNFASADFRKIKTYNFRKSESY